MPHTGKSNLMDNRRSDYRHRFAAEERLPVTVSLVDQPATLKGDIVNLSVNGAAVLFPTRPGLAARGHFRLSFRLPLRTSPLVFEAAVTRRPAEAEPAVVAFRFLPLADPEAEEARQQAVWQFLLEEQRREIRHRRQDRSRS
jgi:hypothetical protein